MKHLREYSSKDLEDLTGDLESIGQGQLKGWIIAVSNYFDDSPSEGTAFFAISAFNVKEAYDLFKGEIHDLFHFDVEDEKIDQEYTLSQVISDLSDIVGKNSDWAYGFNLLGHWEGLYPKSKDPKISYINDLNPLVIMENLNKEFSNAQSILASNRMGN